MKTTKRTHYYLAYGMNTNHYSMQLRCPDAVFLDRVIVPNYKFRFAYHADALASEGDSMECALWEITDADLASLDRLEGYPRYYNRKQVAWKPRYGQQVLAWIYFMNPGQEDNWPSSDYLRMLQEGYMDCKMGLNQIEQALAEIDDGALEYSKAQTYMAMTRKSFKDKDFWF